MRNHDPDEVRLTPCHGSNTRVMHEQQHKGQVHQAERTDVGQRSAKTQLTGHEHRRTAAQHDSEVLSPEHEAIAAGTLVPFQGTDRQRVDGHVLRGAEEVVRDHRREQPLEVLLDVDAGQQQQGQQHQGRAGDNPGASAAPAVKPDQIDERRPRPFEGPGQEERSRERANRLERYAVLAHERHHGNRREPVWNPFGNVQQAEGQEATIAGVQQVPAHDVAPLCPSMMNRARFQG